MSKPTADNVQNALDLLNEIPGRLEYALRIDADDPNEARILRNEARSDLELVVQYLGPEMERAT